MVILILVTEQILRLLGDKKELFNNCRLELQGIELQVLNCKQREGGSTFEVRTVRHGFRGDKWEENSGRVNKPIDCHVK